MAERLVLMFIYQYVERVSFSNVDIVTTCNDRLILEVCFLADGNEVKEKMIIHNGKYHFHEGNKLKKIKERSERMPEPYYEGCMEKIMEEANRWCEDLGLPKLTLEF